MDKLDTLVNAIEKRFMDRANDTKIKADNEAKDLKIKELAEKVEKMEAMPIFKKDFSGITVGTPDKYKGYEFKRQFTGTNKAFAPDNVDDRDKAVKEVLDIISKAALQVGTDSEGGYLSADTWAATVEEKAALISVAMRDCRRVPMAGNVFHIPYKDGSVTITATAEETALTESEPTYNEKTLTAKKFGVYGLISNELLQDATYDIVGSITRDCVERLGQFVDNQVFNGTLFTGLLPTVTTNSIIFGTTGTAYSSMTDADWYKAIFSIPSVRTIGAKFYLARQLMPTLSALESTNGARLMSVLGGAQAASIGGYPFEIVEAISGTDTALAQAFAVFGSLQNYALGIKLDGNTVSFNPNGVGFKTNQSEFRIMSRMNGTPIYEDLFAKLGTAAD